MAKAKETKQGDAKADPKPKAKATKKPVPPVVASQSDPKHHNRYRVKSEGRGALLVDGCDESEAICEYHKQMQITEPVSCTVELVTAE